MRRALLVAVAACGSSTPPPAAAPVAEVAHDAAVEPPLPDAGIPQAALDAPPWVFRYSTKDRTETWTLRYAEGTALLAVENAQGEQHYNGTASEGDTMKIEVLTGTAKISLDCKRTKRRLSNKCNDTKAKPIEVLDCYHPDFKNPMPFGPAPGVEYTVDTKCNGYRLAAP